MKNKGMEQSESKRMKKKLASTSTLKPVLPPSSPWLELPDDFTAKILQKLGLFWLLFSAQSVCTTWRKICRDPTMWRVIDIWKFADDDVKDKLRRLRKDVKKGLCRIAVNLGQGQVREINIGKFGSDDLLEYIAERCVHLRCLRLAFCENVSGKTLSRAVKRFPQLEELHLQFTPVKKDDIKGIGQSCPMLNTFALNAHGLVFGIQARSDEEAVAVATSMPQLRHLRLFGNGISNEGLEAILNGCPKLVSLDVRQCWYLNLEGEMEKRCAQQIEVLQRPHDNSDDYEANDKLLIWEEEDDYLPHVDTSHEFDCDVLDYDYDYYEDYDHDFINPFDWSYDHY